MKITNIYTNMSNNYLVEKDGKTLLIDCSCNVAELGKLTTKLDALIITHGHFDHFLTLEEVQKHYACPVFMHKDAFDKLSKPKLNASDYFNELIVCNLPKNVARFVTEGKQEIAGIECEIFYAFGHTNDSILIAIENALFVGDFLFEKGYGRADLPTGNFKTLMQSLRKYLPFRQKYTLFYGHS